MLICRVALLTVVMVFVVPAASDAAITTEPVGRPNPEWKARQEAINKRINDGNVDLIFIGDSITEYWEVAGKSAWDAHFSKFNAANLGISGDRTQHVLWRLDNGNLEGIKPKAAVMMIGTNNSAAGDTAEEIGEGIAAIVKKLHEKTPETKILILAIFPREEDANSRRLNNIKANELASKLADNKRVFYMDIGSKFLDADKTISREIMPDLLHLSPLGYEIWASAIDNKVQELMEKHTETRSAMLKIEWREGPEYPTGIQGSSFALVDGAIVSAGGVSRSPKDILTAHPDAFQSQQFAKGGGFTSLAFAIEPRGGRAQWTRIANIPGPARQAATTAVVGKELYAIGGFSYSDPHGHTDACTYRDTYRLSREGDAWKWSKLPCELPWPVCEAAAVVIEDKIYLVGGGDFYSSPGSEDTGFYSDAGRNGEPVGRALLMLDTHDLQAGWKRLADIPGSPRLNTCAAGAGGKIYALGGVHRGTKDGINDYYNVTESWVYDPLKNNWTRLPDVPAGANRRAVTYADRYILLIGGYKYEFTWNADGTRTSVYSAEEKTLPDSDRFENTVLVFDTKTYRIGTATPLLDPTAYPMLAIDANTVYSLGGEGGRRLFHPATFQIGVIAPINQQ